MAEIIVVGSLNMDLVATAPHLPGPGQTLLGGQFFTTPGGKGANQAFAAARLGGNVAMLGRVGPDDNGRQMLNNLARAGCDVSGIGTAAAASGVALILVADSGENMIVVVPGANAVYTSADFARDVPRLAAARFVLLQLETPLGTVLAAAVAAKAASATVILDPAPAVPKLARELLRHVTILTPNESEARQLVPGAFEAGGIDAVIDHLRDLGATQVVLKLGARGCYVADGEVRTAIAAPAVRAVDTTAAGDTFNGALAVALTGGASLTEACRYASRAAALSVTRAGAQQSMPSLAELLNFSGA